VVPRKRPNGQAPDWTQLYELAAPQAGYFTLAQAREAGYSPPLLAYYVRVGRLERAGRAIFRLSHFPPGEHEDLVVAWLWSERLGIFSHETALMLHELSDALPAHKHLTVPTAWEHRRLRVPAGVVLHYGDVADTDRTWKGPVPLTNALRSILDCSRASAPPTIIEQAIKQGMKRGLFTRKQLQAAFRDTGLRVPTGRVGR